MPTTYRIQGTINSAQGPALTGVEVYICNQPLTSGAGVVPPAPLANLYTDSTGTIPLTNPVVTDGLGNWYAYLATGTYTIVWNDLLNRIPVTTFADQNVTSPGGGSVTSVALTMDGVVFNSTVSGSPVSSSGTLAPALLTQLANRVLAGPSSGSSATPTWRQLVANDFSSGLVSSVAISTAGSSSLLSITITGSPITSSGTITIPIQFTTFSANTVIAGPTSGSAATPTARALVAADIFGLSAATFAASMTFSAALFACPTFALTLTGNVTSSTISNPTNGQVIIFKFTQNATGGWTFAWPTNVLGWQNVDTNANAVTTQSFVFDGTNWRFLPGFNAT